MDIYTLTAVGATEAIPMIGYTKGTIQFTVANINANVVLRAEGSNLDNPVNAGDWFNLNVNNVDTTITANGTNAFGFDRPVRWIRGNFVSESDGTDAIVTFAVRLGK